MGENDVMKGLGTFRGMEWIGYGLGKLQRGMTSRWYRFFLWHFDQKEEFCPR
jgi:hypothetical protein